MKISYGGKTLFSCKDGTIDMLAGGSLSLRSAAFSSTRPLCNLPPFPFWVRTACCSNTTKAAGGHGDCGQRFPNSTVHFIRWDSNKPVQKKASLCLPLGGRWHLREQMPEGVEWTSFYQIKIGESWRHTSDDFGNAYYSYWNLGKYVMQTAFACMFHVKQWKLRSEKQSFLHSYALHSCALCVF